MTQKLTEGARVIRDALERFGVRNPRFHVVLGSGFKDALEQGLPPGFQERGELSFSDVPGLHPSTAPGHSGKFVFLQHRSRPFGGLVQVGRLHGYEGLDPREVVATVLFTRELGVEHYFLTNAAGGMDPAHSTGDVMLIRDQINLSGRNPLSGENPSRADGTPWGPRFQDLTKLFDREWTSLVQSRLLEERLRVHQGVYVGVAGPAFETPAEIRFFQTIGGHAVGMSTVWETIALKHSGARVCALSLISNIAAGLSGGPDGEPEELDHFAILDACRASSTGILRAILLAAEQDGG
jgi:purine-nucleoside phosphorylase